MKSIRTCVTPEGRFVYGIHKPSYRVKNLRRDTTIDHLGRSQTGFPIDNHPNFPQGDIDVETADWIFEIANPFPFRGTTFIDKEWADISSDNYQHISLAPIKAVSLNKILRRHTINQELIKELPEPVLFSLATCSTDPEDLIHLAEISCTFEKNKDEQPVGLQYCEQNGRMKPAIHNRSLFKAVANNPSLPDNYKTIMVVRPGAQGQSEIIGEWPRSKNSHVFEYLRRNSYIAGGHYAANMSDNAIRYSIKDLSLEDMKGLRHLYYQRTFIRLAEEVGICLGSSSKPLTEKELETVRLDIVQRLDDNDIFFNSTLWGWNFGFDYAPSKYRLHGSHQQIHQQYAMIPEEINAFSGNLQTSCGTIPAFGCGDMVAEVVHHYRQVHGTSFFNDYIRATLDNERMDERHDLESSLVVWQDENVMLFVPKAQTSQWELQLVTLGHTENGYAPGNIVEADSSVRNSLDVGILTAQKALAGLGARMVTSIEYPKRIGRAGQENQHLLYSFLPRLPESPGAFSEAQLRFINGHYPEDFAAVCRGQL